MLARAVLATLTVLALAGCESVATTPPTQPLAPPAADVPAEYARFHGVWSGKWDDTWDVTFVIDDVYSNGFANGHYYWKETVPGAWRHQPVSGNIRNDAIFFNVITITLDPADPDKAVAVGRFELHTRAAKLSRLSVGA